MLNLRPQRQVLFRVVVNGQVIAVSRKYSTELMVQKGIDEIVIWIQSRNFRFPIILSSPIKINQYLILKVTYSKNIHKKSRYSKRLIFCLCLKLLSSRSFYSSRINSDSSMSTATESTATAVVSATTLQQELQLFTRYNS
jgi:hypothetical protein